MCCVCKLSVGEVKKKSNVLYGLFSLYATKTMEKDLTKFRYECNSSESCRDTLMGPIFDWRHQSPLPALRGVQMRGGAGLSKSGQNLFKKMGIRADDRGPLEPWQQAIVEDYEATEAAKNKIRNIYEDKEDRTRRGGRGSPA